MERIKTKLLTLAYFASFVSASFLFAVVPVKADQLTSRKLEIESSQPGSATQNIWHEFTFNVAQATSIGSMEFLYCTQPLGTCTAPTGLDFTTNGTVTLGSTSTDQTINGSVPSNVYTMGTGGNVPTANRLRIDTTAANSISASQTVKIRFDNIDNPTTSTPTTNTFFVRVSTYSGDTGGTPYTGAIDDGAVASAIVPLLTVSARVQEVLHFCVDNATTGGGMNASTALGTDCSNFVNSYAVAGTSVDLGIVDSTTTGAVSPDADGNASDGMFMIRSNALNGAVVGYRAVQQSGTNHPGSLRVVGQSCNAGSVATDRCFNAATTKTALVASTEQFGMTGRFINRTSSSVPTANLTLAADYDSTSTTGYAWQESGVFSTVASASDVIDDEAVVLGFAAVAALTTPPGQYQAQADFIAVPTY